MDAGSSTCQIYPLHLGPHWIMLLFTPLTRSPSSPFHCFLCLTDVRHAVTGSAPEMLRREETQGSRGSLSYHRRYKRRLADAPEEKPVLVYTWGYGRLNKLLQRGPIQLPIRFAFLTSVNYTSPLLPLCKQRPGFGLSSFMPRPFHIY